MAKKPDRKQENRKPTIAHKTPKVRNDSFLTNLFNRDIAFTLRGRRISFKSKWLFAGITVICLAAAAVVYFTNFQNMPTVKSVDGGIEVNFSSSTEITDAELVKNLSKYDPSKVVTLNLAYCGNISDLTPVSKFVNLKKLYIDGTSVGFLDPISGLKNLSVISMADTGVTDITPLSGCTELTQLCIDYTGVDNISVVTSFKKLTLLSMKGLSLKSYTPVAGLTGLTSLDLQENYNLPSVAFLKNFKNLVSLNISNTGATDISFLSSMTELKSLTVAYCTINDFSPLKNLTKLENLSLYQTGIKDISILSGMTNMKYLNLALNTVSDISILKNFKTLDNLSIYQNPVSDIAILSGLTTITVLNIGYTKVTDYSPLDSLKNLKTFSAYGMNLTKDFEKQFKSKHSGCEIFYAEVKP